MKVIKSSSKQFQKLFHRFTRRDQRIEDKVRRILDDVKNNGDEALIRYTRKFDKIKLTAKEFRETGEALLENGHRGRSGSRRKDPPARIGGDLCAFRDRAFAVDGLYDGASG